MVTCPKCSEVTSSVNSLELHLKLTHQIFVSIGSPSFNCSEGCFRDFCNWKTYRRHLLVFHNIPLSLNGSKSVKSKSETVSNLLVENDCVVDHSNVVQSTQRLSESSSHSSNEVCNAIDAGLSSDLSIVKAGMKKNAEQLFSKLYSDKSISRKFIQTVVTEVEEMVGNDVSLARNFIQSKLLQSGVSVETRCAVDECLYALQHPFKNLTSDYLRLQNFRKLPLWVEPKELIIGDAEDFTASKVTPISVKMAYTTLSGSLKGFMESDGIFHSILEYVNSLRSHPEGVISNFIQSKYWKSRVGNKSGIHFPVFVFSDDFQVNNCIGPHSDSGKLGGVYCSIPVLPPHIRSHIDNIFVVLLFKSQDRDLFSNAPVFSKLLQELEDLQENGLTLSIEGISYVVYFHLGLVIGDNLGINSIFDFVACFRANYCCRFCKIHRDSLHFACKEDPSLLRTLENYNHDVLIEDPSATGILRNSIWNTLPNFHVTNNPCVDPMHDLMQGVCHYDLAHVLTSLISKGYFTLDILNFHIASHDYGCLRGENKPTSIRVENLQKCHFKMSASEMLAFTRNLSVMVGHLVPEDEPAWHFYLLLRKILDIVLCPVVTPELCDLLESVIEEHNDLYVTLFKDTLKPKHHNLVHYPRIMRLIGPLVHLVWCMRYESKNQAASVAAGATKSRKNILKTLSIREQISQVTKKEYVSVPEIEFSSLKHCPVSVADSELLNFVPCLPKIQNDHMFASFVICKGVQYKVGSYINIGSKDEGSLPIFARICFILVNVDESFRFLVRVSDTECFSDHFHAYIISHKTFEYKSVQVDELVNSQVFNGNFTEGSLYISSRHIV